MPDSPKNKITLLTPPGAGAIAVIRIIGEKVTPFLRAHFTGKPRLSKCAYGEIRDGEKLLDDAIVVLSNVGRLADLSIHGGVWIVHEIIELARKFGFELIPDITFSAQTRDEILQSDLLDRESIIDKEIAAWLPEARTELAIRVLLAQADAWRRFDRCSAEEIVADQSLRWLLNPPRVAIIGIPNVGKSTLANQLFAQERSITADLPGTTRDWVGEIANIDGLAVMLLDTPGIRQADDPIENLAIERSAAEIRRAELIIAVIDFTRPFAGEQSNLLQANQPSIIVLNKSDRPPGGDFSQLAAIHTVATTGAGVDELRAAIRRHFRCHSIDLTRPKCWTQRQKHLLQHSQPDGCS